MTDSKEPKKVAPPPPPPSGAVKGASTIHTHSAESKDSSSTKMVFDSAKGG